MSGTRGSSLRNFVMSKFDMLKGKESLSVDGIEDIAHLDLEDGLGSQYERLCYRGKVLKFSQ